MPTLAIQFFLCLGALAFTIMLGIMNTSQWLVRPINRLSRAVNRLSRGDFDHWMDDEPDEPSSLTNRHPVAEVGLLAESFNRMGHNLQHLFTALQDSEAHQRALISAIPDLIMRVNRAGIYLEFFASPSFRVLGHLKNWVGTHVNTELPPDLAQERLEAIQKALQTQSIQVYEQSLTIEGIVQHEEVRVVPYSEDEVLLLVRDISERKVAETNLRASEQRFRRAIEDAPFPIMIHAEDGEVLQISSTWTELTGYIHSDIPTVYSWAQRAYGKPTTQALKDTIAKKYTLTARWEEGAFTINTSNGDQRLWQFSSAPPRAIT